MVTYGQAQRAVTRTARAAATAERERAYLDHLRAIVEGRERPRWHFRQPSGTPADWAADAAAELANGIPADPPPSHVDPDAGPYVPGPVPHRVPQWLHALAASTSRRQLRRAIRALAGRATFRLADPAPLWAAAIAAAELVTRRMVRWLGVCLLGPSWPELRAGSEGAAMPP